MAVKKQAKNKAKSNAGRPTVMTEVVVSKLHNAFAIGATVEEACRFAGITRETFYKHIKENAEFSDTIEGVKDRPILKSKSVVIQSINSGDLNSAKWYLERKCRKEFSTQHAVDVNVLSGDMVIEKLDAGVVRAFSENRKPEK